MLNAEQVLTRLDIDPFSVTRAVSQVRDRLDACGEIEAQIKEAVKIVMNVTGQTIEFINEIEARHMTQSIVQQFIEHKDDFNPEKAIEMAKQVAVNIKQNPAYAFLYSTESSLTGIKTAVIKKDVAGTMVVVKTNGKIKKGGKQLIALDLYKLHVVNSAVAMTNQDFIKLLMKECDMSKAGATTYSYNCKKAVAAGS